MTRQGVTLTNGQIFQSPLRVKLIYNSENYYLTEVFIFLSVHLINKAFFHKLDAAISQFIWNKKPQRIKKAFLQRPNTLGYGVALISALLLVL